MAEPTPDDPGLARQLAGALHDLRQPLDALAIYADLLTSDPAQAAELAPRMARAVALAQGLARSLQDFAALGAHGAAQVSPPLPVSVLLADLSVVYEPLARHKGLRWRVRGLDAVLHTDATLLHRLLGNLLANAIGYTARGGVLLAVRQRGTGLVFEVWDTGAGMAPQDQQRVFEPFVRLGAGGEGAGLGLAVVRALAERLGCTVALRSRPGRGSVFRVTLRVQDPSRPFMRA